MPVQRIRYLGEPVLRQRAEPVSEINDEVRAIAQDLIDTMLDADGLGLAAPQIGLSRRIIVVRVAPASDNSDNGADQQLEVITLINPQVVSASDEQETSSEGCLSLPTLQGQVPRHVAVQVRALGLDGSELTIHAEGLIARALQHEIDHLDGILFIDRADPQSLVWLVPDEDEEDGHREVPTTIEEVTERFEQIARRRAAG